MRRAQVEKLARVATVGKVAMVDRVDRVARLVSMVEVAVLVRIARISKEAKWQNWSAWHRDKNLQKDVHRTIIFFAWMIFVGGGLFLLAGLCKPAMQLILMRNISLGWLLEFKHNGHPYGGQ